MDVHNSSWTLCEQSERQHRFAFNSVKRIGSLVIFDTWYTWMLLKRSENNGDQSVAGTLRFYSRRTVGSHLLAHFLTSGKVMAIRQQTPKSSFNLQFFFLWKKWKCRITQCPPSASCLWFPVVTCGTTTTTKKYGVRVVSQDQAGVLVGGTEGWKWRITLNARHKHKRLHLTSSSFQVQVFSLIQFQIVLVLAMFVCISACGKVLSAIEIQKLQWQLQLRQTND